MLRMDHGFCADWLPTLQIALKKVSFNDLNRLCDTAQWRSQNAEKVKHIKGRQLDQAVILLIVSLFIMGTSHKGKNCSHREQILSFKSSFFWYGKSLLPH